MFSLLYIDDEPGLLELGQLFLERTGEFTVTTTLSAEAGLACLAQRDFDAVISDYQMPGMDGISLLKNVRKSYGNIPFVLFTGRGREEVVIEAINNGVDFYLQKGGDPKAQFAELAHKVRQAVIHRQAETALSDSEKRLADIINFLPDATFAIDTQGVVIAWNRAMEQMTGVSSAGILGKGNFEYAIPFYRERRPMLLNLVLSDNQNIAVKYPFVKREGKTLFSEITTYHFRGDTRATLWFTASPLYNWKGELTGAIESIRNITERKQAEENLVSANREYTNLLDQIQDVYYRSDTGGRLVRASRSWATLFGYDDISECLGKNIADEFYVNPPDRKRLLEEIYRNGKVSGYEVLLKKKDGTPVLVEACSHLYHDPAGTIIGVEGTFRDITARKKAEEELRAVNEQLVASEEELRSQYDELAENEKQVRMSEMRLTYMLGFYDYSQKSEKELLGYAIEGAGIVTGSSLGYLAFLNEDESELAMYAWSQAAMDECSMREKPIIYKTEKTGLWGEAVRQRCPVITNDYAAPNPAKKGYPGGHPQIIRHMNVPVLDEGRIVLVAGVANKLSDYTEKDASELLLLVQGLWTIIKRKRSQDELKAAYEQISASDEELRQQYGELAVTQEDLQKHKLQLDEIAGALPGVIYQFYARPDGSMGFYYISSRAADVFDISSNPEDFFERFTQHVDPRDREAFLQSNRDVARDGLPWHYEGRFIKPSGDEIWFEGISRPIRRDSELVFNGVLLDITARKRAEEALFNLQQMLQAVLDSIPQRVFWKDTNSVFLGCNKPLALDAGFSEPADMVGKTDYDHASHETAELYRADDRQVMETGQPRINYEEPQIRSDGSHAWLRTTKVPLRNKEGTIIGVLGTYEDITERKRSEEALRTRSEEYRNILRTAMDGFCIVAMDGSFIDVNDAFCKSLGYTREEVLTRSLPHIEVRENPDETACLMQDIISKGWDRFETRFRRKDGGIIDVEVSVVYTGIYGGRFITFSRDITERQRAEDALRESEGKYRALVESSFDGIVIHQDGILVYVNQTAARLLGSDDPGVFIGRPAIDLVAPAFRELILERIGEAPEKPLKLIHEQFRRLDGTAIDVDVTSTPGTWKGRPAAFVTFRDITEQKRAEVALRESESRWRQWIEQSPIPIGLYRLDGTGIYSNVHFVRIIGYTLDEIPDMETYWRTMFPDPQYRHEIQEAWEDRVKTSIVRGGYVDPLEARISCRDGVTRTLEFTGLVIGDKILVTYYDLTTRKKAQDALHESEEKYRTLVEVNRDIIYSLDTDGTILYTSPQITAQLGYMPDEVVGHNFTEIVHPDDIGSLVRHIRENFITGKPVAQDQFRLRRKDGTYRWYEDKSIYATDRRGRHIVSGTIRDITEEKTAQDALRESEEKFRALVETTSDFIWEVDAAGVYTYVSPQVYPILGYEPEELIGRTPFDFMPPDETEKISSEFNRCVTSRLPIVALENKAIRKDGSVVVLETSGVVRTANNGRYLGYRGIDRDITTRKEAAERTTRLSALKQDLLRTAPLEEKLKQITDGIVDIFGADFARIWMTRPGDLCDRGCIHAEVTKGPHICRNRKKCLHLIASSGRYTHTDGNHRRVPFGAYKIGRLATGDEAHFITNDVTHDPRVHDHAWAESLGLVSFSGFQLVSPDGEPIGVLAFFSREPITQDIVDDLDDMATTTSQVIQTGMAEEAQWEREEWARTILNTAQTGIVLIDAETHRILDANPKAIGMIGLPRDSVIGRVCHYFICPAEKGNCPVTDGGQVVDTSERILVTASETMIPVLKTVVSVSLGGKKVLVESFVDISEQKRSEAAIREANRKLNLLSSITRHDVANQLTVIQGYTQLAALSKPEPVIADFLAKIELGVDTIQRQIEFTRTYQDLGVQAPAWFLIRDVVSSARPEGLKLVCTCKSYEIYADPMIGRVFFNLYDNAARYGERVTTVRVGCAKKGKKLVIRFADNGVGIPSTEKKKIFIKGYGKHTGFGLFLAREILAITGITIQETGTYGKGAVFEITVPEGSFRKAD